MVRKGKKNKAEEEEEMKKGRNIEEVSLEIKRLLMGFLDKLFGQPHR